ncbi:MAG: sigma-70 family RNA polymerase sigma factor [Gemmiger sp.]|uniref:sigma-70 family RNA polymerase sigma factor n=1 Tax=Gemmiger sp. TaxID=2049027 RepID=UPI002E77B4D4|nr:sigma-70 family RNA polymerase sigma factor [Gemmiger sp.]MEE0708951.1 sigma-70 family RNA polymerase sigma factor [Gemmiger sp.]
MESSLYTCIQEIQHGNKEQMLALLEKFKPLLRKYAYFLHSEDAYQELQCALLKFAMEMRLNKLTISTDGAIINYINKAVYHQYVSIIRDSKAQIHTVHIDDQADYDPLEYDIKFGQSDTYTGLLLQDLKHVLTDQEYYVIYEHFFQQRSIQEIADKVGQTRQGINQCKNTALKKLRRRWVNR